MPSSATMPRAFYDCEKPGRRRRLSKAQEQKLSQIVTDRPDARDVDRAMQTFLDALAETIGPDERVLMPLDRAGWHVARDLKVPSSIMLGPLPTR